MHCKYMLLFLNTDRKKITTVSIKSKPPTNLKGVCYLIHSQVVNKSDLPRYEIDTGETTKYVSPEDVAKLIFHKMKGIILILNFFSWYV